MHLTHMRELTVDTPQPSGHAFLSAASGMVVRGSMLYVVADDAHCLAVFDLDGMEPGRLIPLIEGDLPRDAKQRKKVKPDFEILLALPDPKLPHGQASRLLALGSGSKARRMRGAIIDLPSINAPAKVHLLDLEPLFSAIAPLVPEVNLEGAVLRGDHLLLFNRGTMTHPASHILEVPLTALLQGGAVSVRLCATLTLPSCAGVPLTVTDACRLDNDEPNGGRILLSAVAEATNDSYADGALLGAAIVELDADLNVRNIQPLEPIVKVEGLSARIAADGVHILCVTDADDPDRASALYSCVLMTGDSPDPLPHSAPPLSPRILVDADACPVKEEIYKVAYRRNVPVVLVSNARFRIPDHPLITRHIVSDSFDAADDWIAEQADGRSIVITADILLADRCLKAGAVVIGNNGKPFTSASIGSAVATRAIMADLRAGMDGITGGPAPFAKADRSRFLQSLDEALVRLG